MSIKLTFRALALRQSEEALDRYTVAGIIKKVEEPT